MLLQLLEPGQTPLPHAQEKGPAVGIDLGTTHSLVALSRNGEITVLPDETGHTLLPSVVHFKDGVLKSGISEIPDAQNNLRSFKRFMTSRDSSQTQDHVSMHRFKIQNKEVTPVEASAEILKTLKARAEKYTDQTISQAVITVPAYFDDAARTATRDAARLAGLEVLRLINEPTAAALAYGLETEAQGIYAIYDLGGGTFDFSLLRLEGEIFQVLATGGDTCLGGDDFDALLSETFLPSLNPAQALVQARWIKEYLSHHDQWQSTIEGCEITVFRSDLEKLAAPLIHKTFGVCRDVLRQGQVALSDIRGVVLVGGSTRMPLVRQKVAAFFNQEPLINLNPDEVVAQGAALQAEALTQGSHRLLLDVTPLSLGLETYGGIVEKIIPRNSPIPTTQAQEFTTCQDNQTAISFHIVQGERELAQDCRSLATFHLRALPARKAGSVRIRVIFTIDADGILTVHAQESDTGIQQTMEIRPGYGLTEDELLQMIEAGYQNAEQDITERTHREAQVETQRLIAAVEEVLKRR